MKIDEFVKTRQILEAASTEAVSIDNTPVYIYCSILSHATDTCSIEFNGTIYSINCSDIIDISDSTNPVVTRSGRGLPVCIQVDSKATLTTKKEIIASELNRELPFVLKRPSHSSGISFPQSIDAVEQKWMEQNGINLQMQSSNSATSSTSSSASSSTSTHWTNSTSPSTWDPRLDNYTSDDSNPDGNPPDDSNMDDTVSDDQTWDGNA